jgi:ParB family chromosome partitioning protein
MNEQIENTQTPESEVISTPSPEPKARKPKAKTNGVPAQGKLIYLAPEELSKLTLPKDDTDARWDPRMGLAVPKWLVTSLEEHGVETPIEVSPGPKGTFLIDAGKTRVRAIPLAYEILRKKRKPLFPIPVLVKARDEVQAMDRMVRENEHRRDSDAVTKAETMMRMLDVGKTEGEVASQFRVSTSTVSQYLALLGLPDEVKKMVREGRLGVSAAVGISKLSPEAVAKAAKNLIAAAGEGRVTGRAAAKAAGHGGPDTLGRKAIKDLIEELKVAKLAGAHGDFVKRAAQEALECVLDARRKDDLWDVLDKLAKGKLPKEEPVEAK